MTPAQALETAIKAEPEEIGGLPADAELMGKPGTVSATDYGRDPIPGVFAGSSQFSMTVARDVAGLGRVNVHVPRMGYSVAPIQGALGGVPTARQ